MYMHAITCLQYVSYVVSTTITPTSGIDFSDDDCTCNCTVFIGLFIVAIVVIILLTIVIIYLIAKAKKVASYSPQA